VAKHIDLAKIFGVEGMITPKTLVNEKLGDVERKTPHEASEDVKALLDEMTTRVVSADILGVIECLDAIQMRLTYMRTIADRMRKASGK
jgi:hypothetical protein